MKRLIATFTLFFILIFCVSAQTIVVNADGTHSIVINNGATSTVVNPDGTHTTVINNGGTLTIVNADGTHTTVIHNGTTSTIVNPDGTHTTVVHNGTTSTIVNPDGFHSTAVKNEVKMPSFKTLITDSMQVSIADTVKNNISFRNKHLTISRKKNRR